MQLKTTSTGRCPKDKYTIFRKKLGNESTSYMWTKPRMALFMLEQGELECQFVLNLDGDAVINNLHFEVQTLQRKYFSKTKDDDKLANSDLLMTCHWHYGLGGRCQNCRCFGLNEKFKCSEAETLDEYQRNSHCGVNAGVYFVRNSPSSRDSLRWWAGAGEGSCSWTGDYKFEKKLNLAEQKCANRMKAVFPDRVNIVNARVMNTPSWFDVKKHTVSKSQLIADKHASVASHSKCFGSNVFVCHTLGVRAPRARKAIFAKALSQTRTTLQRLCAEHAQPYIELTRLVKNDPLWWNKEN